MKSRIEKKLKKKKNPELVKTIIAAKKQKNWLAIANIVSTSKRKAVKKNLFEINNKAEQGDTIIVPGKVLGIGEIDKKIKIIALSFSETAIKKIKEANSETGTFIEEIKSNPKAEGVKLLR